MYTMKEIILNMKPVKRYATLFLNTLGKQKYFPI